MHAVASRHWMYVQNAMLGSADVTHQWSKTKKNELQFPIFVFFVLMIHSFHIIRISCCELSDRRTRKFNKTLAERRRIKRLRVIPISRKNKQVHIIFLSFLVHSHHRTACIRACSDPRYPRSDNITSRRSTMKTKSKEWKSYESQRWIIDVVRFDFRCLINDPRCRGIIDFKLLSVLRVDNFNLSDLCALLNWNQLYENCESTSLAESTESCLSRSWLFTFTQQSFEENYKLL